MAEPVNRLNDYVFKRIFGVPENKDILVDFLNSIILTDLSGPLIDLDLDDRELDPEFFGNKAARLDILATAQNGTQINIEIQIVNIGGSERRTLFYWSRLYGGQLVSGLEYKALLPVIAINVVNFEFLPDPDRFHQTFLLLEHETHRPLTRDCEIHFLEIPKFKRQHRSPKTKLDHWLTYLSNVQGKALEQIAMTQPAIKKAMTIEEIFAQSDRERRQYELREKGLRDLASIRGMGREEGREEGHRNGREEHAAEVVQRMLEKGIPPEQIVDLTGVPLDKVRRMAGSRVSEPSTEYRAQSRRQSASKKRSPR